MCDVVHLLASGAGVWRATNGDFHEGLWSAGLPHGQGTHCEASNIVDGVWIHGKLQENA